MASKTRKSSQRIDYDEDLIFTSKYISKNTGSGGVGTSYAGKTGDGSRTSYSGKSGSGSKTSYSGKSGSGSKTSYSGKSGSGAKTSYSRKSANRSKTTYSGKSGSGSKTSYSGKSGSGSKTSYSGKPGGTGKKRRTTADDNFLVLKLLILVAIVIVVFEGRLILTMFTHQSGNDIAVASSTDSVEPETDVVPSESANAPLDTATASGVGTQTASSGGSGIAGLAGLSAQEGSSAGSLEGSSSDGRISEELESASVVPYVEPPIDDSYFRDAVFIGDSRMEGFRNTSGITQGTFLTSVGMSLSSIGNTKVNTSDGEITVYQGLSGIQYGKIYLMLGTNDLGYYPWEQFQATAESVLEQFHKLQPNAVIYVCSVIYVEGQKISTDYVNNDNVRKVNGYLLNACEDLSYCYYLNLNEIFSNGYGALIDGATADGVHLQPQYSSMMLDYLKTHYVTWDDPDEGSSEE